MTAARDRSPLPDDYPRRAPVARAVLGILVGYAVFAVTAIALFRVTRQDPHAIPSPAFLAGSIAWGVAWSAIAGYLASVIAGRRDLVAGVGVALLTTLGAVMSIVMQPDARNYWSQIAAIVAMAPAAVVGAHVHRRRRR